MKLVKNKKKVAKSYSFLSILANLLVSTSVSGLMVMGVLSSEVALPLLVSVTLLLGLLGAVGRFIDESVEDGNAD
jgi:hypothetical protein